MYLPVYQFYSKAQTQTFRAVDCIAGIMSCQLDNAENILKNDKRYKL